MFKVLVPQGRYNLDDDHARYRGRGRFSGCRFLGTAPRGLENECRQKDMQARVWPGNTVLATTGNENHIDIDRANMPVRGWAVTTANGHDRRVLVFGCPLSRTNTATATPGRRNLPLPGSAIGIKLSRLVWTPPSLQDDPSYGVKGRLRACIRPRSTGPEIRVWALMGIRSPAPRQKRGLGQPSRLSGSSGDGPTCLPSLCHLSNRWWVFSPKKPVGAIQAHFGAYSCS